MTRETTTDGAMQFESFCAYAEDIEATSGNAITDLVADLLVDAGEDIDIAARFIQGEVFPATDQRKVKMGPSLIRQSLAEASGLTEDEVEDRVAEVGGTGEVCEQLDLDPDAGQQTLGATSPTLADVYSTFEDIAAMSGAGSQKEKVDAVANLLHRATPVEGKYIVRLILSEMRIGVGSGTVRDAIAQAFDVPVDAVERALQVTNDVGAVAETARDEGQAELEAAEVTVGVPVEPMLAQKCELESAIDDAGSTYERVAVDKKYDGSRLQVHKDGDEVTLFTRGLEDETDSLPDIVELVREEVEAESAVIDAEVTAVDPETGEREPFTEVTKRVGRKHDIEEKRDEINTELHAFDLLYADGESFIDTPLGDRHARLQEVCPESHVEQHIVEDTEEINRLKGKALQEGDEGVMVKNPASTYEPGKRGKNWLKLKAEPETLDCVVVGGEWGEGRRAKWIGAYLLAVRDEDDQLKTIGKVGTGLTDAQLADLTERLEPLIESEDGQSITFQPEVVFEIKFEELQPSPTYTSGYGLRFPRFVRVRDDQRVDDADTIERVENLADD